MADGGEGKKTGDYTVTCCAGADLSQPEQSCCVAIITAGDAVDPESAGEELLSAIRQVFEGGTFFPTLVDYEMDRPRGEEMAHRLQLTPRQSDVLRLIAQGRTMKEVASELGISTRTAESHKYEMMEVMGVQTTAELVQYALKLGLVST